MAEICDGCPSSWRRRQVIPGTEHRSVQSNPANPGDWQMGIWAGTMSMLWEIYRFVIVVHIWVLDWVLSMSWLDFLLAPLKVISTVVQAMIAEIGLLNLTLIILACVVGYWLIRGRSAGGMVELLIGCVIAALATGALAFHHAVDGRGRPLAVVVTPGQSHDGRALELVLADIWVPRLAVGRPRTTPAAVLGDKAYSSRGNREMLRRRGIKVVIPEPSDQQANRKLRGAKGGRPPKLDRETYKQRNVVERSFNLLKQWRGLATRYDKHAVIYRGGAVLAAIIAWLRTS